MVEQTLPLHAIDDNSITDKHVYTTGLATTCLPSGHTEAACLTRFASASVPKAATQKLRGGHAPSRTMQSTCFGSPKLTSHDGASVAHMLAGTFPGHTCKSMVRVKLEEPKAQEDRTNIYKH